MKNYRTVLYAVFKVIILAVVLLSGSASAQNNGTQGRDFWVMFLYNLVDHYGVVSNQSTLSIVLVSEQEATVTIEAPQTGWSTTLDVPARSSQEVTV